MEAEREFEVTTQYANTVVNVTVRRNEYQPRFTQSEYRVDNLPEMSAVGTSLLTVTATDQDQVIVISCI